MNVDELKVEHVRLISQAEQIHATRCRGVATIEFDGVSYTVDEADELTRAALYELELQLEAAGVYG